MEALERWIRSEIEARGPVPFEQFMAWALYHPVHGYYASGRAAPGRDEGDFTTAPQMSELFGTCLATLVSAADRALGAPAPFRLVEGGAGEGRLGRQILDTLELRNPGLYARLEYSPEESGTAWRPRQEELLAPHGARLAAAPPDGFEGLYLSNELVDALPVHRLVRRGGELLEVHVGLEGGRLTELLLAPSRPELAVSPVEEGVGPEEGCEVEVNLRAVAWMESVARRLRRGYVVTIDYGDEASRLYGPQRAGGTCLAYERHRSSEALLERPGLRDLTAHVNFTALRRAGLSAGLEAAPLRTQREFLFALGFLAEVEGLERRGLSEAELLVARKALAPLLFPGMGEDFRVLVQAKGVPLDGVIGDPVFADRSDQSDLSDPSDN